MTPERFRQIVASYGAEPHRWPADERDAAQAFLRGDGEARALLEREAGLDRMLGAYRVAPAGSALAARVAASAHGPSRQGLSWSALVSRAAGLVGIGAAGAVAGALLVLVAAAPAPAHRDEEHPFATAFDTPANDYDVDEIQ